MQRREFITLLGGAAAWPLPVRAQQRSGMRRIGVLMATSSDDPESQLRLAALLQGLQERNWTVGRNISIEYRWNAIDPDLLRRHATEIVAQMPDVILTHGGSRVGLVKQLTRTIPIIFVQVIDPVGGGYVESLSRPGGNATGFAQFEYGISAKWLEFLKQIAPRVKRAAVLRDPTITSGVGQLAAIQSVAPSFGTELRPIDVRNANEIERGLAAFVHEPDGGLIVTASTRAEIHRDLIVGFAGKYHLPAVYPFRFYAARGGLMSYGPDEVDQWRLAVGYIDRILKGDKPADLPVQAPTKYETVINLKTAKALGLDVPTTLLVRADEVIDE